MKKQLITFFQRNRSNLSFLISILLHAVFLTTTFYSYSEGTGPGGNQAKEGAGEEGKEEKILPPIVKDIEVTLIYKEKGDLLTQTEKKKENKKECKDYYGGLGITSIGGMVFEIYKGYPAYGVLKEGDQIIEVDGNEYTDRNFNNEIRGEVGTSLEMKVLRGNRIFTFRFIRAKVCVEEIIR